MSSRIEGKRPPSHPGRVLRTLYMEPLELTITALAERLGVSRKTVSKIINGRGAVTSEMALRLSRAFDTTPDVWMNLQKTHALWHAAHGSDAWQNIQPVKDLVPAPA